MAPDSADYIGKLLISSSKITNPAGPQQLQRFLSFPIAPALAITGQAGAERTNNGAQFIATHP